MRFGSDRCTCIQPSFTEKMMGHHKLGNSFNLLPVAVAGLSWSLQRGQVTAIFSTHEEEVVWEHSVIAHPRIASFLLPYTLLCIIEDFQPSIFLKSESNPDVITFIDDTPFYWNRYGSFSSESDFEACDGTFSPFSRKIESYLERIGAAAFSPSIVGDFVEAAKVVGGFLEIGHAEPASIPQRPDQRQEGCLAGAVLADEQGQRRHASRLFLAKAAEVLQCDPVHGSGLPIIPAHPSAPFRAGRKLRRCRSVRKV